MIQRRAPPASLGWRRLRDAIALPWLGLLTVVGLATTALAVQGGSTGTLGQVWRSLGPVGSGEARAHSLARSARGDLAVGDDAGVSWWRGERRERALLPGVRDLAFNAQGVLWIATAAGLHRWSTLEGRPERRTLHGGEMANSIHRLTVSGSTLLLATDAGAYWSSQGRIFQRLPVSGRSSAALRVALRLPGRDSGATSVRRPGELPAPALAHAWIWAVGRLSLVRGLVRDGGLRVSDVRSLDLPRPGDDRLPADLVLDPEGRRLFLVFEDLVAWRPLEPDEDLSSAAAWQLERPVLPPGARIRRIGWADGRVWLATDHGLLEAASIAGPFRRAASPVGTSACWDLEPGDPGAVIALCRPGLFVLAPRPARPGAAPGRPGGTARDPLPPDPPVAEIRRRALARAGLSPERGERLWSGLRRRAFWPELSLRFGAQLDRDRSRDRDQSFVSGATRRLHDRSHDEGEGYAAAIELEWDLGGVAYPDESVDLSRELRQVVSLRDDVADEIHQIYFERLGIRQRLASSEDLDAAETQGLLRRARELDAGLDAWTGGWLSRWRLAQSTVARRGPPSAAVGLGESGQDFAAGPVRPVEMEDER